MTKEFYIVLKHTNLFSDCLSGGTATGKIANWRHCHADMGKLSKQWILQEAINIDSEVSYLNKFQFVNFCYIF